MYLEARLKRVIEFGANATDATTARGTKRVVKISRTTSLGDRSIGLHLNFKLCAYTRAYTQTYTRMCVHMHSQKIPRRPSARASVSRNYDRLRRDK